MRYYSDEYLETVRNRLEKIVCASETEMITPELKDKYKAAFGEEVNTYLFEKLIPGFRDIEVCSYWNLIKNGDPKLNRRLKGITNHTRLFFKKGMH